MLNLIDLWVFSRGEVFFGGVRCRCGFWVFSRGFEVRIHRDCLFLWSFDVFHYDLRGDSFRMGLCGIAGCLF